VIIDPPDIHEVTVLGLADLQKLVDGQVDIGPEHSLAADKSACLMLKLALSKELEDPQGVIDIRLRNLRVALWNHFENRNPQTFDALMDVYDSVFI
jgi:hypothetical protein